jgi:hypothetical protein
VDRRIRAEASAAAIAGSPATPGAVLNAGAESRLLSPSVQLQLVFDEEGGTVDQGAGPDEAQSGMAHQQQPLLPQQQQSAASLSASDSPQASDLSSCMVPLGLAAKAQPAADTAVLAPSPPASTLSVTPGMLSKPCACLLSN